MKWEKKRNWKFIWQIKVKRAEIGSAEWDWAKWSEKDGEVKIKVHAASGNAARAVMGSYGDEAVWATFPLRLSASQGKPVLASRLRLMSRLGCPENWPQLNGTTCRALRTVVCMCLGLRNEQGTPASSASFAMPQPPVLEWSGDLNTNVRMRGKEITMQTSEAPVVLA